MTPAQTEQLTATLAPVWERLRECLIKARAQAASLPEHATRADIAHVRAWIFLLECLLRRLVLIAATGVETDAPPGWSTKERATPEGQPARQSKPRGRGKPSFRLYAIRRARRGATSQATNRTRSKSRHGRRQIGGQSDTLVQGRAQQKPGLPGSCPATPAQAGGDRQPRNTSHHTRQPTVPPDMTPEEFMDWAAVQTFTETSAEAATRQMKEIERAYEAPRKAAIATHAERRVPSAPPEILPTRSLLDRLDMITQLIANPEPLIQRAARAMTRARDIAYALSLVAAPRARGLLRTSPLMFSLLIPVHMGFSEAMNLFALSYIDPNSS